MDTYILQRAALLTLSILGLTSSFVFDSPTKCPIADPCFCIGDELYCEEQGLTTFPSFTPTQIPNGHFAVNLAGNAITVIPSRAFVNLKPSNSTEFDFFFIDNKIASINRDAFLGVEDRVTQLFLDGNELKALPEELQKLTNLRELTMEDNPITSLTSSVTTLTSIAKTLATFDLSLSRFKTWPSELSILKSLKVLYLTDINLEDLPLNAFAGFENTLEKLAISGSNFINIPETICNLPNLKSLELIDQLQLSSNSIVDKCFGNNTSVVELILSSKSFNSFPNVFNKFSSLIRLGLNDNELSTIEDGDISSNQMLRTLSLDFNNFTSIPSVLGKLTLLVELSIESNLIKSIGNQDLTNFNNLKSLILRGNPLESISGDVFRNTPLLEEIDLSQTRLRMLPSSLLSLPSLQTFDIANNPTECTCVIAALKNWDVSHVSISGNCGTSSMSVLTYITHGLKSCP